MTNPHISKIRRKLLEIRETNNQTSAECIERELDLFLDELRDLSHELRQHSFHSFDHEAYIQQGHESAADRLDAILE
ncbi:hypothetical protein ACQ4M3_07870 [Leptolyngbya sp. AN03gr2]|uniref:hypothetical protein n=1 Tax=unclassified Leptolyngbya TaxID=2650499 RepID=UPI003D311475